MRCIRIQNTRHILLERTSNPCRASNIRATINFTEQSQGTVHACNSAVSVADERNHQLTFVRIQRPVKPETVGVFYLAKRARRCHMQRDFYGCRSRQSMYAHCIDDTLHARKSESKVLLNAQDSSVNIARVTRGKYGSNSCTRREPAHTQSHATSTNEREAERTL